MKAIKNFLTMAVLLIPTILVGCNGDKIKPIKGITVQESSSELTEINQEVYDKMVELENNNFVLKSVDDITTVNSSMDIATTFKMYNNSMDETLHNGVLEATYRDRMNDKGAYLDILTIEYNMVEDGDLLQADAIMTSFNDIISYVGDIVDTNINRELVFDMMNETFDNNNSVTQVDSNFVIIADLTYYTSVKQDEKGNNKYTIKMEYKPRNIEVLMDGVMNNINNYLDSLGDN